ncbi:hypothetical protein SAMN02910289_00876 [Lachnospiraceae bacterium RM5]|nr:hypothetical protein SAMN02910289_00876 [Lachnospiraceae bacterium RM5]
MKKRLNSTEIEFIKKELRELGIKSAYENIREDNTYINGITFFDASDTPECAIITYVEDDLVDEKGVPYIFDYPYLKIFGKLQKGQRLIALYIENNYYVIPVNGETYILVGAVNGDKDFNVDRSKSIKMPSPLVLDFHKQESRLITKNDVKEIKKTVKANGKLSGMKILGSVVLSFLVLMIVSLIYIFWVASYDDIDLATFVFITVVCVILLIVGIVFSILFFKNIYIKNALRMKYIKEVMVVSVSKNLSYYNVAVYEWVGNNVKFGNYTVGKGQFFIKDNQNFGDRIYMLTKKENERPGAFDARVFVTGDFKSK